NGSKIYDRGILAGIGNYLSGTRARWDLFLEEDFLCRLKGIERWQGDGSPRWKAYDRPVEEWKAELFNDTPASLTGTLGALAATGSLVLWPDRQEPRLMSLEPPLH
ncbi:LUD domain-containing protein, partial [Streptomyces sp. CHB9.2]|nr:LUD domain-containing protein [Streptomyces sp. CHB9.2]